jgi:3-methyladenine DNA glycosylase AlkD
MARLNRHHEYLLKQVKACAGPPVTDKFLNSYLGANRRRYRLNNPQMRRMVGDWIRENRNLTPSEIAGVITSLIKGVSVNEKMMGGFILDRCSPAQRKFNPKVFVRWLDHLEGWAEVDTFCAGKYSGKEIPSQFPVWRPLIRELAQSRNINKRRASLVLLCAPLRYSDNPALARLAFANIKRLSGEKPVIITKAISWLMRSMVKRHRTALIRFMVESRSKVPAIAVRETETKLSTGRKTRPRAK